MKSIQKKLGLGISIIMLISTGTLMITAMRMSRSVLNSDSDVIIRTSADYYAEKLNHSEASEEELRQEVADIDVYGKGNAFLMSKDKGIIYHTLYENGIPFDNLPQKEKEHFSELFDMEKDKVLWHTSMGGLPSKIIVKELDNGLLFGIKVTRFAISQPQRRLVTRLLFISISIVLGAILIGLMWVVSIIRPLTKMTEVADRYAKGDYSEKMAVDQKDEVGQLSKSLEIMSESLVKQIELADAANKAKSTFLSNMSHEIRTPITAVLGFNEMIRRETKDNAILEYSENISAAGNTLLGIINDILDFSKIEAGKIEIVPVDYDLSSVINDLVNMTRIRAEEKGLGLRLDFDRNIPKILNGDEVRIKQIITNLLTNAVKYTEKGSITFGIGYEEDETSADSVILKVFVKDTGIGIKEEDMEKLFQQFERIDEKRNRNIEGTGLGLNITEGLLELMGSKLQVESRYGEGSVFSFSLKQKVVNREPLGDIQASLNEAVPQRRVYRSAFTASSARILMVDDNATNLLVFKNLLKATKARIDTASGGDECLKMCADIKYDLIFLDHMMPGKDGIETLHELREQKELPNADTPVISLTANAVSGARENYIREGFRDYLTKPIDPDKLEKMLMTYLPKEKIDDPEAAAVMEFTPAAKKPDQTVSLIDPEVTGDLDALRDQDDVDMETGLKYCGNGANYLVVLASYRETSEEVMNRMDGFLADEDLENYQICVHSIKSTSKMIGASSLSELAAELENAAKLQDSDFIRAHHEELKTGYVKVRELLDKVFRS